MGELIISAIIGGVIILAAFVGILVIDKDIERLEESNKEENNNDRKK